MFRVLVDVETEPHTNPNSSRQDSGTPLRSRSTGPPSCKSTSSHPCLDRSSRHRFGVGRKPNPTKPTPRGSWAKGGVRCTSAASSVILAGSGAERRRGLQGRGLRERLDWRVVRQPSRSAEKEAPGVRALAAQRLQATPYEALLPSGGKTSVGFDGCRSTHVAQRRVGLSIVGGDGQGRCTSGRCEVTSAWEPMLCRSVHSCWGRVARHPELRQPPADWRGPC